MASRERKRYNAAALGRKRMKTQCYCPTDPSSMDELCHVCKAEYDRYTSEIWLENQTNRQTEFILTAAPAAEGSNAHGAA